MSSRVMPVLLVAFLAACSEQRPPPQQTPSQAPPGNAADEYLALASTLSPELIELMKPDELSPEMPRALPDARHIVDQFVWASTMESADWGVDYSLGSQIRLDHLSPTRDLVRLVRTDTRDAVLRGDTSKAADSVAAIVRMSRHIGGKSVLEKLHSGATMAVACDLVTENPDIWTDEQRAMMLTEFLHLSSPDPFDFEGAISWEKRKFREHLRTDVERARQAKDGIEQRIERAIVVLSG